MGYGEVTDEGVADLRSRIGRPNRKGLFGGYNTAVTVDNIRHFVDGIGDMNPLFREEGIAQSAGYPTRVAPPSFLFSIHPGFVLQGLRGAHALNGGHEWEFYAPALLGDELDAESCLKEVKEKTGRWSGRVVFAYDETKYFTGSGVPLAKVVVWNIRGSRSDARQRGKYDRDDYRYTEGELRDIDEAYLHETYRGSLPRYWEDVSIGESLDEIVRGPLSLSDLIAYYSGAVGAKAHGIAMAEFRRHPDWAMKDSRTGAPVEVIRAHEDPSLAKSVGFSKPYDIGGQRCSWALSMITNWMGDAGFPLYFYSENRRPVHVGDTVWLGGTVTDKRTEGGRHLVDIETWGKNQMGESVIPGRATVWLPSRSSTRTPVDEVLTLRSDREDVR